MLDIQKEYGEEMLIAIKKYMPDALEWDDDSKMALILDVVSAKDLHSLYNYYEYFKFGFYGKNEEYRNSFVGGNEYDICCKNSRLDNKKSFYINKYETYERYKEFYKRDIIRVNSFDDFEKFKAFAREHNSFLVKDTEGSFGDNISKISISDNDDIKSVFFRVLQYGDCVCEELIKQCDEFKMFNSTCVNTIRVTTFFDENKVKKIYGMFRTGRQGSLVDNASLGGIASAIDLETGKIVSDGYTKSDKHFIEHPDSKLEYKGYQIPRWNEVFPLIEKMHSLYPNSKLVGWDLTLTDNGWVMIEGNGRPNIDTIQLIYSKTFGKGLRAEFENSLGKYKNKTC